MTLKQRLEVYAEAIYFYGTKTQIIVAIEEMSELIKELTKNLRGEKENIVEEIADVEIMLEQLIFMKNLRKAIDEVKDFKVNRLIKKIKKDKLAYERVNSDGS